jgi:hypothetical protein
MARVCDHKNIVQLHEVFEDANYVYIVMEPCLGARAPAGAATSARVCSGSGSQAWRCAPPRQSRAVHGSRTVLPPRKHSVQQGGSQPEARTPRLAGRPKRVKRPCTAGPGARRPAAGAARRRRAVRPDRGARAPDGAGCGRQGARAAGGHPALPLAVRRALGAAPAPGLSGARMALGACQGTTASPRLCTDSMALRPWGARNGGTACAHAAHVRPHARSACAARVQCAASPASSAALSASPRSREPLGALGVDCGAGCRSYKV